jgi:hypothetical protein
MNRLWLALLVIAAGVAGGTTSVPAQVGEDGAREFTVRVAVEEVRLDAVVLDKKGRPITDLTAADFEIYQDTLPQEVTSATYISNQTAPEAAPGLPGKRPKALAPLPVPVPEREEVNRTIVCVVDDMSMRFEHVHYARMAMQNFVEKQMRPGDMVAILRTGHGNSFQFRDLDVSLASGCIDGAGAGYVLRSWIQLDSRNLTLREKPGEGHFAEVETVALTSDIDGWVHDSRLLRYLFRHMAVLYNAKVKEGEPADLELQSLLYRDGVEAFRSAPQPLDVRGVKNFDRIPVIQKFTLGRDLAPGDYVLELLARDKRRKEKDGLVSQALDFQITAPPGPPPPPGP